MRHLRRATWYGLRHAFSLIEILISILILSLGILGLGALFPAVIREQRNSTDAVVGAFIAQSAAQQLRNANWGVALEDQGTNRPNPIRIAARGDCIRDCNSPDAVYPDVLPIMNARLAAVNALPAPTVTGRMWQVLLDVNAFSDTPNYPIPGETQIGFNGLGAGAGDPAANNALGGRSPVQDYEQGQWWTATVLQDVERSDIEQIGDAIIGYRPAQGGSRAVRVGRPDSGSARFSGGTTLQRYESHVLIPVRDRLQPSSGTPLYIWDYAIQRVPGGEIGRSPLNDRLRAAVFVRRIDQRIRVDGGGLRAIISDHAAGIPPALQRVPIGEIDSGNQDSFEQTGDGTSGSGQLRYSGIKAVEVEFWFDPTSTSPDYTHRDRLYFPAAQSTIFSNYTPAQWEQIWQLVRQPGQRIVDNLGNVYTVTGSGSEAGATGRDLDRDSSNAEYIKIDPPIATSVTADMARPAVTSDPSNEGNRRRRAIWQIAFTPQIPVAVQVVEIPR